MFPQKLPQGRRAVLGFIPRRGLSLPAFPAPSLIQPVRNLLILLALCLSTSLVSAQNVVLADDFNDSQIDPMWTLAFNPLQFWDVHESGTTFNYNGLTAPFGALDERFALSADIPGTLPAGFQLDMAFAWNEQIGLNTGESAEFFVVRLMDAQGLDLATFTMDDQSSVDAGNFVFGGATTTTITTIPPDSDATFSLVRDSNMDLSFTVAVTNGPTSSGSLGNLAGTVAKVEFYVSHTQLCGPCGPWLGQLHVDDLKIYDGPLFSGPSLSTPGLVAGSVSQLDLSGATANGPVAFAYSTTGAGPTLTPFGLVDLSAPSRSLPTILADANGDAQLSSGIPAGASGLTVWLQAYDVTAGALSNGLMESVL